MVIVAVTEPDEARDAEIADAAPVAPIGQRHVQRVLFVVAPAPRLFEQTVERERMRIGSVSARLLTRDRRSGRRYPGRLPGRSRVATD
jgi:hypothetical protein